MYVGKPFKSSALIEAFLRINNKLGRVKFFNLFKSEKPAKQRVNTYKNLKVLKT